MRTTKRLEACLHPNSLTSKNDKEGKNQNDTKCKVIHECVTGLGGDKKFKNRRDWNNFKFQRYYVVDILAGSSRSKQKCLQLRVCSEVVAKPTLNRV